MANKKKFIIRCHECQRCGAIHALPEGEKADGLHCPSCGYKQKPQIAESERRHLI